MVNECIVCGKRISDTAMAIGMVICLGKWMAHKNCLNEVSPSEVEEKCKRADASPSS